MLASANRDQILNALGHEFGHYSKEDNKTGTQTIANYSGEKLEDRTKGMVSKEATEDTLAAIRNNKNVITGEEGKKLAESIPMERREYKIYQMSRPLDYSKAYYEYKEKQANLRESNGFINTVIELPIFLYKSAVYGVKKVIGLGTHGYALVIPDD